MHAHLKLGRIRPTKRQRALAPRIRDYLTRPLPPAPPSCKNSEGAALGMFGNDRYGDCTFAALANQRAIDAARAGLPAPPTTEDAVIEAYLRYTGNVDLGAVEIDVLTAALKGVDIGGPEPWMLASWVTVDLTDLALCKSLIALFRALYLGVELPTAAQTQPVWEAGSGRDFVPGSWGGHALLWADYDQSETIGLATWGEIKPASLDWLAKYGDQGYVLLPAERAVEVGIDWEGLAAYVRYAARG